MSKVKVTLAVGAALTIVVGVLTLSGSPQRVVRANEPSANSSLGVTFGEPAICQANEVVPAGVSAMRLSVVTFFGSDVHLVAYRGSRVLTEGRRGADWTGTTVTVPVKPVDHTTSGVRLCFVFAPNSERIIVNGHLTPARETAVALRSTKISPTATPGEELPLKGRVVVEYLAAGRHSWWSEALSVARRLGLGHFFSGTWVALLIASLMAAMGILAVRLTLRELP